MSFVIDRKISSFQYMQKLQFDALDIHMIEIIQCFKHQLFCLPGKTKDHVDDRLRYPASAEVVYCPFKNRKFITSADISGSIGMDGLQSKLNPDRFDPG